MDRFDQFGARWHGYPLVSLCVVCTLQTRSPKPFHRFFKLPRGGHHALGSSASKVVDFRDSDMKYALHISTYLRNVFGRAARGLSARHLEEEDVGLVRIFVRIIVLISVTRLNM